MKRVVMTVILAGAAWMGIAVEAQAQAQIMPAGPMSVTVTPVPCPKPLEVAPEINALPRLPGQAGESEQIYPGRTMGGGRRILRSDPPPSFLNPTKE